MGGGGWGEERPIIKQFKPMSAIQGQPANLCGDVTTAVGDGKVRQQIAGGKRSTGVGAQFDLGGCNDLPGKYNQHFSRAPRAFDMLMYISY